MKKFFALIALIALCGLFVSGCQRSEEMKLEIESTIYVVDVPVCSAGWLVEQGHYDYYHQFINEEYFPVDSPHRANIIFCHSNRSINQYSDILGEMDAKNLRPATMSELLALGAKYPDLQRHFWIVELGSVFQPPRDSSLVGVLNSVRGLRQADLGWIGANFNGLVRFAVVRK